VTVPRADIHFMKPDSGRPRRFWGLTSPVSLVPMKLRSRLIILACVALMPMVVSSAVALAIFLQHEHQTMRRSAVERVRALSTAVDASLLSSATTLEALATSRELDRPDSLAVFYADAERVLKSQPDWRTINLALPSGEQLLNLLRPLGSSLPEVLERPSFDAVIATGQPALGDLVSGLSGKEGVAVRVPVIRDGVLRYVLAAIVKPESLSDLLSRQNVPGDWVVSVLDRRHRLVARTRGIDQYLGRLASADLIANLSKAGEGWHRGQTLEGQEVYSAFSRSQVTGWTVAIGIPAAALDGPLRRASAWMVVGIFVSTALALGLAVLSAREIAEPVVRLTYGAAAVSRGEPPGHAPTAIVEVGQLARALDDAAMAIRHRDREKEKLLDEAQAARREAEGLNRAKDEFLAMLGHELRNPLGAISSAVYVLGHGGEKGDNEGRPLKIIARQTAHLARLVDDLLDLGRLTTGKILLHREPADLAEIVRQAMATVVATGSLDHVSFEVLTDSVWIEADVVRIEQIVGNLLSNSAKFTPPGGQIRITTGPEGGEAVVRVKDTGSGIDARLLPRVFDLFVQGAQPPDRERGGLGIGLTLVRRLVEMHGGTVEASSAGPGQGSTFTLRFPAVEGPVAETPREQPPEPVRTSRRVLIVEDNADSREMLRTLLTLEGHDVSEAVDGPSAIEAMALEHPDIAFIDIGLPGIDGYEVARQVRAQPHGADMFLVALTGYGLGADRERSRDAGFDVHLVKPFHPDELKKVFTSHKPRGGRPSPS
jgi:signal transduction histidine kinase/ActR/RegA family two-component response regulator